jgi:hypothetical protein
MQRVIITASKLNNSGIGNSARLSSELATKFGKKHHGPVTAHTPFLQNHQQMYLDLKP